MCGRCRGKQKAEGEGNWDSSPGIYTPLHVKQTRWSEAVNSTGNSARGSVTTGRGGMGRGLGGGEEAQEGWDVSLFLFSHD